VQEADIERMEAGADAYLAKPFRADDLLGSRRCSTVRPAGLVALRGGCHRYRSETRLSQFRDGGCHRRSETRSLRRCG
jgi:DNA-binding response OmpR family regulator